MTTTVPDCNLHGDPIRLDSLHDLTSDQISEIVGVQDPSGDHLEQPGEYKLGFERIFLRDLRQCNEDGEEPEGGWKAAYLANEKSDRRAIEQGSPEYAGRQEWLREWADNTAIYPIYVVFENGSYRLWDGYRRVAGAFWHDLNEVSAFVGYPKS
jgi:hypothetical protein